MPYFELYKQTTAEYSGQYKRKPMYREIVTQWKKQLEEINPRGILIGFKEAIVAVEKVKKHLNEHDTIANAFELVEEAHEKTQEALQRYGLVNAWRVTAYKWKDKFRAKHGLPYIPLQSTD